MSVDDHHIVCASITSSREISESGNDRLNLLFLPFDLHSCQILAFLNHE